MTGEIHVAYAGRDIQRCEYTVLTARSVETVTAHFDFDAEWDGYTKTAVFASGDTVKRVLLDRSNQCIVPWEVLTQPGMLQIGAVGTDGDKILPSVKALVCVNEGIYTDGTAPSEPTPTEYAQLISLSENAKAIAQSVRDDADAGKFDGEPGAKGDKGDKGDPGDSYTLTDADKAEIAAEAAKNTYTKSEIDAMIGDVDATLDAILALQQSYIGGTT